jgi:hypothetical protein
MSGPPRMIRLANADGSLEFATVGVPYTGNSWCLDVDVVVQHLRGEWRFRGDFCRIDSLEKLANWFDAVATGQKPEMCLVGGFMYPVFVFHVRGGHFNPNEYTEGFSPTSDQVFRVTLGGWPRPDWSLWTGSRDNSAFMDFPIEESNLRAAAAELREQLRTHSPPSPRRRTRRCI